VVDEDRTWENAYRQRWQHDKIVRSTHGVNCTGSCSWKVYVKNGLITWETQQTDYPRTRPDLPNHEPRGCPRGASYSWYVYSAQRVKYPMIRGRLMEMWREARKTMDPVTAWDSSARTRRSQQYKSSAAWAASCAPLGRSQRNHRRRQCLHDQEIRPGPRRRLLADSGHVHGQLRRRHALPVADRRRA
jgi:hypothetical protein